MTASPGKKLVLLINSAPFSREYFTQFGYSLIKLGAKPSYVLDCHLTDVMGGDGTPLPDSYYFSDYCRTRMGSGVPVEPPSELTWASLLSDFDRLVSFGVRPSLEKSGKMSYAEALTLLDEFFEKTFDAIQPDGIVYEPVSNSFALGAYRVAERRGIPFFSLQGARIPGSYIEISATGALRDYEMLNVLLEEVRVKGVAPESRQFAEDYIESIDQRVPDYMMKGGDGASLMPSSLFDRYAKREKFSRIVAGLRYRRSYREDMAWAYQAGDPVAWSWGMFRRQLKRRLRFRAVTRLFKREIQADKYLLYPLHFHPEASTSVLSPDYIEELSVIRAVAYRLPVGVKLVVKEHPSATALQPISFYRELATLPNVELVAPELNSKLLARKAIGVICLTSTLGFEAALLNKPVIAMGDVLYGYFPNVHMIRDFGELDEALAWAMAYEPLDMERIIEAMAAYLRYIERGSFSFKSSLKDPVSIDHVASLVLGKLRKDPNVSEGFTPSGRLYAAQSFPE